MSRVLLVGVVCSVLSGCAVMPPVRASAGVGGAAGSVVTARRPRDGSTVTHAGTGVGELRVAFTPMTLGNAPLERDFDVGFGWTFDWMLVDDTDNVLHGPSFEVAWFTKRVSPTDQFMWRLGPTAALDILMLPEERDTMKSTTGVGGSVGVLGEYVIDGSSGGGGTGVSQHGVWYGGSRGELAVGLSVRLGVRHVADETHVMGIAALEVRFPGIAGVAAGVTQRRGWVAQ